MKKTTIIILLSLITFVLSDPFKEFDKTRKIGRGDYVVNFLSLFMSCIFENIGEEGNISKKGESKLLIML